MARTVPRAVRELCRAFPEVEEFTSHGKPNYRGRGGKVFAIFAVNHHGDGRVALWLHTPAVEQQHLLGSARQIFMPPYVGKAGWIGVELNKGFSWRRLTELVRQAYENSSPARLVAKIRRLPLVAPPDVKLKPAEIDPLKAPRARKLLAALRKICLAWPETSEGVQFGAPVWRVGKRGFALLYDYGEGLTASFWVGVDRQGLLIADRSYSIPPYMGHTGWIAVDLSRGFDAREIRALALESYRHFASKRALKGLPER